MSKYVQYGCGFSAPNEWINFDASPTLKLQKIPIIGNYIAKKIGVVFPDSVLVGDIIKYLPGIESNTCDGVFCSHILEHLAYDELEVALKNTFNILKSRGCFRLVLPDLEFYIKLYQSEKSENPEMAANNFLKNSMLGIERRERGFIGFIKLFFGNSKHLWMWDYPSLFKKLEEAGFERIRRCKYNDSKDRMFTYVEDEGRFNNCLAIECFKP